MTVVNVVPGLMLFLLAAASAPAQAAATASSRRPPFPRARLAPPRRAVGVAPPAADGSGNASTAAAKQPFTAHFFPQELDHFTFTPNSSRVFAQKYLLNDTFWRKPNCTGAASAGPLFVYTGNEGDIEWFATNTGFMFDIAPEFGALLVFIEHRFYGESMPFGNDDSYNSADTLGYLTSTQALADFAILITSLKTNLSVPDAPVVVFGGSYGGMLASWFKLKYPHVAMGALASSAPILQFDHITPWTSFDDAVSQDFKSESLNCFSVIKAVWDVLDARGSNATGLLELSKTFRACKTVQYAGSLTSWLYTAFTYTAMTDYPTPADFLQNLPAYPVKEMCKIIDAFPAGADVVDKAFAAASLYYNYTGDQECFEVEGEDDPHGLNGWGWQACTEMIMPMNVSSESMFPPYGFSYEERSESCFESFGVRPRDHWITTEYGGTKIYQVLKRFGSNIIFSNGLRDPWSRGGVLKNISSSIVALVTEEGAHHLDLRAATKEDPDWVVQQRRQEVEIIKGWIDQYNQDIAEMSQ
uniref:Uncharacterized protein n=1 Tax=Avena sativa TaxID=4498 RepID=A0ACD5ZSF5_AVESA